MWRTPTTCENMRLPFVQRFLQDSRSLQHEVYNGIESRIKLQTLVTKFSELLSDQRQNWPCVAYLHVLSYRCWLQLNGPCHSNARNECWVEGQEPKGPSLPFFFYVHSRESQYSSPLCAKHCQALKSDLSIWALSHLARNVAWLLGVPPAFDGIGSIGHCASDLQKLNDIHTISLIETFGKSCPGLWCCQ